MNLNGEGILRLTTSLPTDTEEVTTSSEMHQTEVPKWVSKFIKRSL